MTRLKVRIRPLLFKALRLIRKRPILSVMLPLVLLLANHVLRVALHGGKYFGRGPTLQGGDYGRRIDNTVKRALFHYAVYHHRRTFQQATGYALPETAETTANNIGAPVLTQTWLAESVLRALQRRDAQQAVSASVATDKQCHNELRVWVPLTTDWYRPFAAWLPHNTTTIVFDETEIDAWMIRKFAWLYDSTVYRHLDRSQQVQLWGVCAVYLQGGIFSSPATMNKQDLQDLVTEISRHNNQCTSTGSDDSIWFQSEHHNNTNNNNNDPGNSIRYVAAAARHHHHLHCVFQELEFRVHQPESDDAAVTEWSDILHLLQDSHWKRNDSECFPRCCPAQSTDARPGFFAKPHQVPAIAAMESSKNKPRFSVTVQQVDGDTTAVTTQRKDSWSSRLAATKCWSGWWCNRCLRMPWWGTYDTCRSVCHACFEKQICGSDSRPELPEVVVQVKVEERSNGGPQHSFSTKRIPRIIHQTWWEDLTADRYPHLQRLQNSWKASGWDYRFYTDSSARSYIQEHFPDRFVQAYDAIVPGAFKADLFRLLVLLREGGIYADIDVQLDVNLDEFVTPELGFFVPRDVAIDHWPAANYCLWNGLMGAAPGHPIIAQAVEDLLNRALNRQDYFDIERDICRHNSAAEIWKLRSFPILLVTGPCALGISVNTALARFNRVQGFELGWQMSEHQDTDSLPSLWGDSLMLLTDRYDLGELRFTDIDRNLLVGSTNQDRFARTPVRKADAKKVKAPEHYSKSLSDIVGESGTYKDNQVVNERIRLQIIRNKS